MFDLNTLYLGTLWGAVGSGFFIYGKKQGSSPSLICGLALVAIPFFIYSPLLLCLAGAGVIAACVAAIRMGY